MPFSFRRSKSFGPFRVTASKSGIGASVGVKGVRVGTGSRGAYVRIGRGAVSYRQRLGSSGNRGSSRRGPLQQGIPDAPSEAIETANVDELVESSSENLLAELNTPRGSWLARMFGRNPSLPLTYELDAEAEKRFVAVQEAIGALGTAACLWLVESSAAVRDRKYHGGAAITERRHLIQAGRLTAPGIATNVAVVGINTGHQMLIFFPDRVLVRQGKTYGAVSYGALHVQCSVVRFNETSGVPRDAQVVGRTWHYVNKSGGPDRRFRDNREIPIALYGELTLRSPTGLHLLLQVSSVAQAEQCARLLQTRGSSASNEQH